LAILLAAFAGGLFGAAIGGLPAFIFTGFTVIAGVAVGVSGSDFDFLTNVAFGPVFGPHIAFAGGAAAAAFAARRGDVENGRDIAYSLAGVNDPIVLVVGGLFGAGGYVFQQLLVGIGFAPYTDSIAFTVVVSALVARLVFGRTGIFGSLDPEAERRGRWLPAGERVWVDYQQGFLQVTILGIGTGLLAAWIVTAFAEANPDYIAAATVLGFGISAASLILLQVGFSCPVTHHMTLPAGVAAAAVVTAGGAPALAVILGAAAGLGGALLGEISSRLFLIHGDTHIDPPANAIWIMTTIVIVFGLLLEALGFPTRA
jgi:hypothetical protein